MHYSDSHIDEEHKAHFKTLHTIRLPKAQWSLTAMVVLGMIACGLFVYFVPWVQTASGTGQVIALNPQDRVQNVTAFVSGRIEQWYVTDGQQVKEGDPIVQLADNDPNLLERLAAEKTQIEAQISAAQSAMAIAQLDVDRSQTLFREGLGSRRDFEQSRIRVAEMQARLSEARASLNQVEVNLSRQSIQTVTAPRDGVIQRISGGAEATLVSQGDVVATFAPTEAKRVVEVYIDGRDVALINPGNPVKLQFEGWPAIQFSGWPSIAKGLFDGRVQSVDLATSANGLFRVIVEEDARVEGWPNEPFVRLGANARGWVLLKEVPVYYELWRQLNDFPLQTPDQIEGASRNSRSGGSSGSSSGSSSSSGSN